MKQPETQKGSLYVSHIPTPTLPQGVEEISCDPSFSPFSFHFLYLPDGKQLTTITSSSPACIHTDLFPFPYHQLPVHILLTYL